MYAEMGIQPSALSVAQHYGDLLHGFILDRLDAKLEMEIVNLGIKSL